MDDTGSHHPHSANKTVLGLLDLPGDVRNIIYHELLYHDRNNGFIAPILLHPNEHPAKDYGMVRGGRESSRNGRGSFRNGRGSERSLTAMPFHALVNAKSGLITLVGRWRCTIEILTQRLDRTRDHEDEAFKEQVSIIKCLSGCSLADIDKHMASGGSLQDVFFRTYSTGSEHVLNSGPAEMGHLCSLHCLHQPALSKVNQLLRAETLSYFYGHNKFHIAFYAGVNGIEKKFTRWWKSIGNRSLRLIDHLDIVVYKGKGLDQRVKGEIRIRRHREVSETAIECDHPNPKPLSLTPQELKRNPQYAELTAAAHSRRKTMAEEARTQIQMGKWSAQELEKVLWAERLLNDDDGLEVRAECERRMLELQQQGR
jgi:hypothetical protein